MMNTTGPNWWSVNIGSGYGLKPPGHKTLPGPMLTQFYVSIWHILSISYEIALTPVHLLAQKSEQPIAGCIAIFHKYCCSIKHGVLLHKFDNMKSFGVYYWYVTMPQYGYMNHGLEYTTFYV